MRFAPSDNPVAYSNALRGILAALVLLGAVDLTGEQVAGCVVALEAVLGAFVWGAVTPTTHVAEQVADARTAGANEVVTLMASEPAKKAAPRKAR